MLARCPADDTFEHRPPDILYHDAGDCCNLQNELQWGIPVNSIKNRVKFAFPSSILMTFGTLVYDHHESMFSIKC